jgi:tetratricopeptide (TPR) repeat protein
LDNSRNAIEYLEQFDGKDRVVAAIALGSTGDAYVELGDLKKGVSYYKKAANLYDNEVLSPLYLKKAGIVYEELGDLAKALDSYKKIKKEYPKSEDAADIEKYISSVEVRM